MTSAIRATWSLDVGSQAGQTDSTLPPAQGTTSIVVKQGEFGDLGRGLRTMQERVNEQLTRWKDALGNEGVDKVTQAEDEEGGEEESSEED